MDKLPQKVLIFIFLVLQLLVSAQAFAQSEGEKDVLSLAMSPYWETRDVPVLAQTPLYSVARRFELGIEVGYLLNDAYYNYFPAQINVAYNFDANWGLELQSSMLLLRKTSELYNFLEHNQANSVQLDKVFDEQLARFDLVAVFHPFYGKWSFHEKNLGFFEFSFYAGVGVVLLREPNLASKTREIAAQFEGLLGVAFEAFLLDWLSLRIDGALNLYQGFDYFRLPCRLQLGVSFYLPAL